MKKKQLKKFISSPGNISGIHDYCNRWCEKCRFKNRCRNYEFEKQCEDGLGEPEMDDLLFSVEEEVAPIDYQNKKFDVENQQMFLNFIDFVMHEPDFDVDIIPLEVYEDNEQESKIEHLFSHPLYKQAVGCYDLMAEWFSAAEPYMDVLTENLEKLSRETAKTIADAIELIQWNRTLILSKTFRAISFDGDSYLYEIETDANGSIKVVLVALDEMFDAWCDILVSIPETESLTFDILQHITIFKDQLKVNYPFATCFVRPGFDEPGY